jgi:hypothetical protein
MPCGFHDATLHAVHVDWPQARVVITGVAWVAEDEPDPEVYRPFRLSITGLRTFSAPPSLSADKADGHLCVPPDGLWCDGHPGWLVDREPEPALPTGAWVFSWFLHALNDFMAVQAVGNAELLWTGPPGSRPGGTLS